MQQMRVYGVVCQECRSFCPIGEIECEATVPPSHLQKMISQLGWKDDWVECDNPECNSKTFAKLDRVILQASSAA